MAINRREIPDLSLEEAVEQKSFEPKKESLADSVVSEAKKGLEEIESRPDEHFYYPFRYDLIFDLDEYLEMSETRDVVLKLVREKNTLLKKIAKRMEQEIRTKQLLVDNKNSRKLEYKEEAKKSDSRDPSAEVLETLEKLIQIGEKE